MMKQVSHCDTSASLWKALEELCASQTRARAVNTRIALATMKKGAMSINEYVGMMKAYADELAAASKALDDEELISFIITGLGLDYNPVISAALGRVDPISVTERGLTGSWRRAHVPWSRCTWPWQRWAWTRELQQQLQLRQAEGPVSDLQEGGVHTASEC
jgi:hypothetical protein